MGSSMNTINIENVAVSLFLFFKRRFLFVVNCEIIPELQQCTAAR